MTRTPNTRGRPPDGASEATGEARAHRALGVGAELDGREHGWQALRRRHRHARHDPDRGHVRRHQQADPAGAPRVRRQDARRPRGAAVARRRGALCGRARLAAFGGPLTRRGGACASDQVDRQRTRLTAKGRYRPSPRGWCPRCRSSRQRQTRAAPTSTTASTSLSRRATRPVGTPVRSARWCCGRKSLTLLMVGHRCSQPAVSGPDGRWRPRWRSARKACGWDRRF